MIRRRWWRKRGEVVLAVTFAVASTVACQSEDLVEGDVGVDVDVGEEDVEPIVCQGLFGAPGPATGLDEEQCSPECECSEELWTAPTYDDVFVEGLREWALVEELEIPESNPYQSGEFEQEQGVCGLEIVDETELTYRLRTFESSLKLDNAGARLTHDEPCGLCSTLQDLAVYVEHLDLTGPVRECGLQGLTAGEESQRACIEELGFSPGCAQIWSWNTSHTREECLNICVTLMDAPHNEPDGSLNDCLACDEEKSGEVFKAVAGRTRRNSGLPSAICRPCDEPVWISHEDTPFVSY